MRAPRLDHFGMSVAVARRLPGGRTAAPRRGRTRSPTHVDLIEPQVEEYAGMLNLHSFYVRYRLPLMIETQHFEYLF